MLVIVPILVLTLAAGSFAQSVGTFTPTGSMMTPRSNHTATLLANGKVLIAGGSGDSSVEIYDPSSGTFASAGNTLTARDGQTATLLPNGRVLIAGGSWSDGPDAELYDPASGTFTATVGHMVHPRYWHTAAVLPNGKVLIVGGYGNDSWYVAAAELYDPATDTFAAAAPYVFDWWCDFCAPAVQLRNGNVLFAYQNWAEIYDVASNTFSVTGDTWDCFTGTALLTSGKVLYAGGACDEEGRNRHAELYDPAAGGFVATGDMTLPRVWHTVTALRDGTVLVAGGETGNTTDCPCWIASTRTTELYSPATGTFTASATMTTPREGHTATLLPDGRVLITGGARFSSDFRTNQWEWEILASAELYTPTI
jgi:WD40 repeat protein